MACIFLTFVEPGGWIENLTSGLTSYTQTEDCLTGHNCNIYMLQWSEWPDNKKQFI